MTLRLSRCSKSLSKQTHGSKQSQKKEGQKTENSFWAQLSPPSLSYSTSPTHMQNFQTLIFIQIISFFFSFQFASAFQCKWNPSCKHHRPLPFVTVNGCSPSTHPSHPSARKSPSRAPSARSLFRSEHPLSLASLSPLSPPTVPPTWFTGARFHVPLSATSFAAQLGPLPV